MTGDHDLTDDGEVVTGQQGRLLYLAGLIDLNSHLTVGMNVHDRCVSLLINARLAALEQFSRIYNEDAHLHTFQVILTPNRCSRFVKLRCSVSRRRCMSGIRYRTLFTNAT